MIWARELPFFSADELACKDTGIIALDMRFAANLPALRAAWGMPMYLSSVCRTPAHNSAEGGHPNSLHLTDNPRWPTDGCMAADVAWRDWSVETKLRFAKLAYRMGWSVGLHDGFCHVDRRGDLGLPDLPQAVFVYDAWARPFQPHEVMSR